MKKNNDNQYQKALKMFKSRKVLMIHEVKKLTGKSLRTTHSRLKQWNALTSYNKNGKYYTLPVIANFNEHGIWSYKGIYFSRHGNLKQTFVYLITNSCRALSSAEIGTILQLSPRSFLSHFSNIPGIIRRKHNGRYLWYATEEQFGQAITGHKAVYSVISDAIGIQILVLCIKNPEIDEMGLVKMLEKQGVVVSLEQITNFLAKHGIEKKSAH